MASLIRAGFGRVVIVGYKDDDADVVQEAFHLLHSSNGNGGDNDSPSQAMIGSTEIAYVKATTKEVTSRHTAINLVKGALMGLQNALNGNMDETRAREWLGSNHGASHWKYVYLTEPDTILETRPSTLVQLKDALDKGMILMPHRLQPLPHESDVKGMKNPVKFVPATAKFAPVVDLNALENGSCCDEYRGTYKPWKRHGKCESTIFWWQCGFNKNRDHSRLQDYQLIRLESGTGVVNLAATEHGRCCIPSISECVPPTDYDSRDKEQIVGDESQPDPATGVEVASNAASHQTHENRMIQFIPSQNLGKLDYFSATWIQPMSTFLKLNTGAIDTVEAGVFRVWKENRNYMRMTLDWLDFSVEHLSKFWKNAQVFTPDPVPYKVIMSKLQRYIENAQLDGNTTALQEMIAVVAFQPYGSRQKPNEAKNPDRHLACCYDGVNVAGWVWSRARRGLRGW